MDTFTGQFLSVALRSQRVAVKDGSLKTNRDVRSEAASHDAVPFMFFSWFLEEISRTHQSRQKHASIMRSLPQSRNAQSDGRVYRERGGISVIAVLEFFITL